MIDFKIYMMEYKGGPIESSLQIEPYTDEYYAKYKETYEACFHDMRSQLGIEPVDSCDTKEQLSQRKDNIYLLIENDILIGSVAIKENEIDDLIVSFEYQHKGKGRQLLEFAISEMQKRDISPIILNVTDWNKRAMLMYQRSGFVVSGVQYILIPDKDEQKESDE